MVDVKSEMVKGFPTVWTHQVTEETLVIGRKPPKIVPAEKREIFHLSFLQIPVALFARNCLLEDLIFRKF